MKPGVRDLLNRIAARTIAPNVYELGRGVHVGLRPNRPGDAIYIMKIQAESGSRGQGFASEALTELCALADAFGVEMFLEVEAFGDSGLSDAQLADWYWRFGFRGSPSEMVREPRGVRGDA